MLWRVYVPLARPVYLAYGLVSVSYHWNNFLWPLIITNSVESRPLTVGLQVFSSADQGIDWSIITAATLMTSAPLLVAFLLFQRQFVQIFMRAASADRGPRRLAVALAARTALLAATLLATAALDRAPLRIAAAGRSLDAPGMVRRLAPGLRLGVPRRGRLAPRGALDAGGGWRGRHRLARRRRFSRGASGRRGLAGAALRPAAASLATRAVLGRGASGPAGARRSASARRSLRRHGARGRGHDALLRLR